MTPISSARTVLSFARLAAFRNIPYRLTTLQLAGYAALDKKGAVSEQETAPSPRWAQVVIQKKGALSPEPDLTDGKVFLDEFVHYLIENLGDSSGATGIQAYSLDNEPGLWQHTHPRIHPDPTGSLELIEKSVAAAKMVKALDPGAEIYGPALYGMTAYEHLADEKEENWLSVQKERGYSWYIDYYLDEMRKASEEAGVRLLDALDIHYYSESARVGAEDRLQAVRSLYEEGFYENSWIGQWRKNRLPLLPNLIRSIETYYPGTKLAITEYNYGGEDISAAIAQAETLACFAEMGVYSAFLWGGNNWQYHAINLFTDYDGKGAAFGSRLIPSASPDHSRCVCCAALNEKENVLTVLLTNKTEDAQAVTLALSGGEGWTPAAVHAISGSSHKIRELPDAAKADASGIRVELPALCAAMVTLRKTE